MRYTCLRTITTKVFDGVLEDPDEIHNLLQLIKDKELTCSMQVKKGPMHESVRILEVDENCITWRLLQSGSSLQKKSEIADIMNVRLHTNDDIMIQLKPKPSRWSTIDVSDI